jgi:hypothetical protein
MEGMKDVLVTIVDPFFRSLETFSFLGKATHVVNLRLLVKISDVQVGVSLFLLSFNRIKPLSQWFQLLEWNLC